MPYSKSRHTMHNPPQLSEVRAELKDSYTNKRKENIALQEQQSLKVPAPQKNYHPLAISSTLFPPSASHPDSHYTLPAHVLHRTYPPYIANSQPHYQTSCPSYSHSPAISSNPRLHYNYPLQRKHTIGSYRGGSMTTFCGTAATGCSIGRSRRGSRSSRP
jgi:hypothetical protein